MHSSSRAVASRDFAPLLARSLEGSWRPSPPTEPLPWTLLAEHTDRLLEAGVGPLVWRRWSRSGAAGGKALRPLQQAHRLNILHAERQETQLQTLFAQLDARGIEAIVCKGWSVARLYPQTGLRSYNDIDLAVAPRQLKATKNLLNELNGRAGWVDLHCGLPDLSDSHESQAWARSRLVPLGGAQVRILEAEDQLRQLCLHFWRHLGCRPLWLCDVGAAIESAPPQFDWDYCLRGKSAVADTILCVVGLAARLLQARVEPAEIAARAGRLPKWLAPSVGWRWPSGPDASSLRLRCRTVGDFSQALLYDKFNPMRATQRTRLSPHVWPPLIQLASLCGRPVQWGVRAWRAMKKLSPRPSQAFDVHLDRVF